MFEQVVTTLLNRILGTYVDNLQTEQLNIGIWSGDVVLKNLRLRKDALDKFDLPIDVVEGYLGDLTVKIPWKNLKGRPFRIFIDNVFLIAAPKAASDYNAEEEKEREYKRKQEILATLDVLQTPAATEVGDSSANASFTTQLVTKMVDNLQISINNIHVRYEDNYSSPGRPFSIGITLRGLSAVSADENWRESFIDIAANHTRKVIKLESLSVYWLDDAQSSNDENRTELLAKLKDMIPVNEHDERFQNSFILHPISGSGKLTINHRYGGELPKYQAELEFDTFMLLINDQQYNDFWHLLHLFENLVKGQKYRSLRPSLSVTPRTQPHMFWQFAIEATLLGVREKLRPYTWQYLNERRTNRINYIHLYKDQRRSHIIPGTPSAHELDILERQLPVEDIRFFRNLANKELRKEQLIDAKTGAGKNKGSLVRSWGNWIWNGGSQNQTSNNEATFSETDLKTLYDTIGYDESALAEEHVMPPDCILFSVGWKLREGALHIRKLQVGARRKTAHAQTVRLVFQDLSASAMQHLSKTMAVKVGVGGLAVWDGFTPNTLYPAVVRTKETKGISVDGEDVGGAFFELNYISEPPDSQSNDSVTINARSLELIYNPHVIDALVHFFSPPDDDAAATVANVARNTIEDFKAQTRAGLEYALAEHKSIDVSVEFDAPVFIFPHSCTDPTATIMVVDSGHAQVKSDLIDIRKKQEIEAKQGSKLDEGDFRALESLMFDKYLLHLSSVQVVIGNSYERCLTELSTGSSGELHVVDRADLNFEIALSILPKTPTIPRMRVTGSLPVLKVNLSDRKYHAIMQTIDILSPPPTPPTSQPPSRSSSSLLSPIPKGSRTSTPTTDNESSHAFAATLKAAAIKTVVDADADTFYDASDMLNVATPANLDTTVSTIDASEKALALAASRVLIDFNFSITHLVASLCLSDRNDPHLKERTVAILELCHFDLAVVKKTFELELQLRLKTLLVQDMLQPYGPDFAHLVSSFTTITNPTTTSKKLNEDKDNQLVSITFKQVDKSSPAFVLEKYEGIEQAVDIKFNRLEILITRDTILQLYDFLLTTFVSENVPEPKLDSETDPATPAALNSSTRMKVNIQLGSVRASLNEKGNIIAQAQFGMSSFALNMGDRGTFVSGSIGDLYIMEPSRKSILQVRSGKVASFRFSMLEPAVAVAEASEWDSELIFEAGSVEVTYNPPVINRIIVFLSEFAQMHALVDAARKAAVQSAAQIQEQVNRFHYDVLMESPVILLPRPGSDDCLKAYPGEIHASNRFILTPQGILINVARINVSKTGLASELYFDDTSQCQKIIKNVDIVLDVQSRGPTSTLPGNEVTVNISDIHIKLNELQYAIINDFMKTLGSSSPTTEASDKSTVSTDALITSSTATSKSEVSEGTDQPLSSTVITSPVVASPTSMVATDVHFIINKIDIELATSDKARKQSSLAYAKAEGLSFQMSMFTNGVSEMEVSIHKFGIRDTRPLTTNKFKDILVRSDTPHHQLVMRMSTTSNGDSSLIVAFDSPKIILILDHMFAIKDFFVPPTIVTAASPTTTTSSSASHAPAELSTAVRPPPAKTFHYRVNLVELEVAVIEDPMNEASEALLLSVSQLQLWQSANFGVKIDGLSMYLCQMTKRVETSVCFVPDIDMSIVYDIKRNAQGFEVHDVISVLKQITLRISYHDVLVLSNIINSFLALTNANGDTSPSDTLPRTENAPLPTGAPQSASQTSVASISSVSSSSSVKKPQLIVSTEKLQLSMLGIKLILIDDMNNLHLPMVDLTIAETDIRISDWSSALRVTIPLALTINYFNIRNSHWEPLVEPWETQISYRQSTSPSASIVEILSRKLLNVNVSHVFVDSLLNTLSKWNMAAEPMQRKPRGKQKPYLIRNRTGHRISLWKDTYARRPGDSEAHLRELDDQDECTWRFENWKKMREQLTSKENKIGLLIHDIPWEAVKDIAVDREGVTSYPLRPKYQNMMHRIVCDVHLQEAVKVITLRSTLCIVNATTTPVELYVEVPGQIQDAYRVVRLDPKQEYYPAILTVCKVRIKVRPEEAFGYQWSTQTLFWSDFQPVTSTTFECKAKEPNTPSFRFQVYTELDVKRTVQESYPDMRLIIQSPLEIENLLPGNLQYTIKDIKTGEESLGLINQGGSSAIHSLDLANTLTMGIKLPDLGYQITEMAIVHDLQHNDADDSIEVKNAEGHVVKLRLLNAEVKNAGAVRKITIFCPYLIVNHLNVDVHLRDKDKRVKTGSLGYVLVPQAQNNSNITMFSYRSNDATDRKAQMQVGQSEWSKPVSFEAVGNAFGVVVTSETGTEEMTLGVTVTEGPGKLHLTRVITLSPRFVIKNDTGQTLQWRQAKSSHFRLLETGKMEHVSFLQISESKLLCVRYAGNTFDWSGLFNIQEVGDVTLRVEKLADHKITEDTANCELIRADIVLDGATLFIIATRTEKWPYCIENLSTLDVYFHQKGSLRKRYCVRSGKSAPYTWDNYALPEKALVLQVDNFTRDINVKEIGTLLPWEITSGNESSAVKRVLTIDIFARGSSMVIQINNYNSARSQYKQMASPAAPPGTAMSSQSNFEQIDAASIKNMDLLVRLEGIGISLVDRHMKELTYITFKGVHLSFRDTNVYESLSFHVKWIQVDNQRPGALSPIVLYPTVIPNAGQEQENHPAFQTAIVRSKDTSHGVNYYKYLTLLLQELSADVDEDFLFALLDYMQFNVPAWEENTEHTWGEVVKRSEPTVNPSAPQMYFELFHLQPIKINTSFSRTKRDSPDNASSSNNPVSFLLNVLSMGIANVHDVPIKLNALVLEHPIVSFPILFDRIYQHYSQEVISQLYKVIGSIDIIGNPVGLFSNIGSGFKDVFYEPYQGFVSDRPQDFALGFAKGAGSLARKTVYGFSDTFSRVTGSVGKGLAMATLDEDFQQTRRVSKARNRPKNTMFGVTTGAKSLAKGVMSGVTGVLTKPLEGAESEGVEGFFKGVGKGLIGLVAKPTLGLFDLANNVSEGIKSTTTISDEREIDRIRLPRFVDKSGILAPFSEREALGQFWLMQLENGKYTNQAYVAHIDTKLDDFVALVTTTTLFMVRLQKLRVEWELPFDEVENVAFTRERLEVKITLRHHTSRRHQVVPVSDEASGAWFSRQLANAYYSYYAAHKPLE